VVYRLSLEDMANNVPTTPDCFSTENQLDTSGYPFFGVIPLRTAGDTMYLAAHDSISTLAVWRWPDNASAPTMLRGYQSTPDTAAGYPYIDRGYSCLTNGQTDLATNWCGFTDDRPTSAFSYGNLIGFAWNASQDSTSDVWKWPSVWVVLIDPTKLDGCAQGGCVVGKPVLRNANFAFGYGAFATNSRGELGATFLWGGGEFKQSCGIGILNSAGSWDLANIAQSDRHTYRARAGDYSGLTAGVSDGSWTSACMTLEAQNDLDTPGTSHFATFGRRADFH
jgi:hypothetical protein